MGDKFEELEKELDALIHEGNLLYYSMADNVGQLPEDFKKDLKKNKIELPNFMTSYDPWYSEALRVVQQIIPDRTEDFIKQYKNEKRKEIDFLTYTISDYLIGLRTTRGVYKDVVASQQDAIPKMQNQNSILSSAKARFRSKLFDLKEVLQADIFDNELEAAKELNKKGFFRGAGALAGVVLEAHLGHVCKNNGISSRKKDPSISDFNDLLKKNEVIDTPQWRRIQHLGDLRNLCDHKKERDPTKEDIEELIEGVDKVIKTLF